MFTAMLKGGYFDIDRYSWKWPSYKIKPIFGVVVDAHLVVLLLEFIQLSGMAFTSSVPWTDEEYGFDAIRKFMRIAGLSIWPSSWDFFSFGGKLAFVSMLWLTTELLCKWFAVLLLLVLLTSNDGSVLSWCSDY